MVFWTLGSQLYQNKPCNLLKTRRQDHWSYFCDTVLNICLIFLFGKVLCYLYAQSPLNLRIIGIINEHSATPKTKSGKNNFWESLIIYCRQISLLTGLGYYYIPVFWDYYTAVLSLSNLPQWNWTARSFNSCPVQ